MVMMTCARRSAKLMYCTCFDCTLLKTEPRNNAGQLVVSGVFLDFSVMVYVDAPLSGSFAAESNIDASWCFALVALVETTSSVRYGVCVL